MLTSTLLSYLHFDTLSYPRLAALALLSFLLIAIVFNLLWQLVSLLYSLSVSSLLTVISKRLFHATEQSPPWSFTCSLGSAQPSHTAQIP
jgi:hypothetical protein